MWGQNRTSWLRIEQMRAHCLLFSKMKYIINHLEIATVSGHHEITVKCIHKYCMAALSEKVGA